MQQKRGSEDMSDDPESGVDIQNPDEARSLKRTKLDAPLTVTENTQQEMMEEEDWDDMYGDAAAIQKKGQQEATLSAEGVPTTIGGQNSAAPSAPHEHQFGVTMDTEESKAAKQVEDGVPAEAIVDGDDLVAPASLPENNDKALVNVMEETTEVEYQPPSDVAPQVKMKEAEDQNTEGQDKESSTHTAGGSKDVTMADDGPSKPKATDDPEFMAAAAAQKSNTNAEWQYDPSDAESSSDSDSTVSSDDESDESDSGSEGGYEMLDPATAAKILMSGDGDDDDGGKGKGKGPSDHQPRTANEVKEEAVPKPDVTITPEMKITHLGNVESVVESMILIKGATPGEYRVLEGGSVLCNEKREVVGAVADTFGRVQEPLYSVQFNSAEEIEQAGLSFGTKVFYVDDHSTFVFTQPLKNMKGTDASNIHDEEVGEDELEFSDDEAEAEFKRQRKLAKKTGRGGLSRSAFQNGERVPQSAPEPFTHSGASDVPTQTYGSGLSYDDNEPAEDFYQPLKRPDNLSQMMAGGPLPPRPQPQSFDRGRGRGRGDRGRGDRGRGRGDRGRGRAGFDNRNQRGGRGGFQSHHQQDSRGGHSQGGNAHRGNAHSFPDRHNSHSDTGRQQHALPPKPPNVPVAAPPPMPMGMPTPQPQYQQQAPQTYQFGGYTFQYGNPPPQQHASAPQYNYYGQQQQQQPAGSMPAGAHVNPAFFQQQAQYQQQPQVYGAWGGQYQQQQYAQPHAQAHAGAQQPQQQQQQPAQQQTPAPTIDISSILKRLGAQ